jgi:uroporphyrinogen decarboxylase
MTFTSKDRVIAQIQHQETDRVPYTLYFEGDIEDHLDDYYGNTTWRKYIDNDIRRIPGPNLLDVDDSAEKLSTDLYGCTWRVDRRPFHLEKPALNGPSLENFVLPEMGTIFTSDWTQSTLRLIEEQRDHFLVVNFGLGLFERTWALRGFEEALIDAVTHPEFYDEVLDCLTDHHLEIIERLVELPVDGIMFSDDWGYQQGLLLGTKRWRCFLKSRVARLYARAHEAGKYVLTHCCGSIEAILPDLIEIGLNVYQSVQPEAKNNNPYDLKRKYGDKLTFWGGLGSQSIISFGTPGEIRAEVAKLCREMGKGGGYVLSAAKPIQPGTPIENAAAVVEAFLEQVGVEF